MDDDVILMSPNSYLIIHKCVNIFSDKPELLEILGEARQRREEERKRQEIF